ncbi:unnamed protein product [Adineta ricciae]|uniref:Homeobox domain-containing protein n=1 Tax=Adineta ricciae TaxID=249248 RepID=A0A813NJA2_ADIRI|nr:unnamed protein product [Adineta ricciae]CAF0865412.1 unnamed protein product [Adineta ricciae]
MPVYYQPSNRKTHSFSIDDIIKADEQISLPSTSWLPAVTANYQYQREYMLQYLRHMNQLTNAGMATAFLLNSYRKPKRNRTAFTPSQLLKLEDAFEKNHYIVGQERKDLAKHLNLPEARVKVWYQNRRTKHKRSLNEDGQSSVSDCMIKVDDEHSCTQEDNDDQLNLTTENV